MHSDPVNPQKGSSVPIDSGDVDHLQLAQAIEQLLADANMTGTELAREVGASPSAVAYWKSATQNRKLIPNTEHCLRMALLNVDLDPEKLDPIGECERWLGLAGHRKPREAIESFVTNNGRLENRFRRLFDEAVEVLTRQTNLPLFAARSAATVRFSQIEIGERFKAWQESATGFAELLVFWSFQNDETGIRPKLKKAVLRQAILNFFRCIISPDDSHDTVLKPRNSRIVRRLHLVIQDAIPDTTERFIREELRGKDLLPPSEWPGLTIYAPKKTAKPMEHIADCWIYNGPLSTHRFGVMVSQPDGLLEMLLTNSNRQIAARPGYWSSQCLLLQSRAVEHFLSNRLITRDVDGSVQFDPTAWDLY